MYNNPLYAHSPPWLQELLLSARAVSRQLLREGRRFRTLMDEARERESFCRERLRQFQWDRMRALLQHAGRHVPYYRDLFAERGVRLARLAGLEGLHNVPLLTKQTIRAEAHRLLAENIRYGRIKGRTSGTTGTPVTIFQDLTAVNRENAFIARQLRWAGYRVGERRAWMRGDLIVPIEQMRPPFWRYSRADNMLMLSSYHISETSGPIYIEALEAFNPTLIQAYPSSIGYLARILESMDRPYRGDALRAIVTSSESLHPEHRELIERRFGCRVFDWYGSFERVSAIGTCNHGSYHVMSDYGYTEFMPLEGARAEIVGTGFNNMLMPLIRFRTGDVVLLPGDEAQCPCGRHFPLVERVEGRTDDCVKTPSGRNVPMAAYNILKHARNVAEAQIVQDRIDGIRILLVPFPSFCDNDAEHLIRNARKRLGREMEISIERVAEIPRTAAGKLRSVVCNV